MPPVGTRMRLSVPPGTAQISTVRSFAFAVGRHEGLDQEVAEDLKLALSELAAGGIEAGGSSIDVSIRPEGPTLEVSVSVPDAGPDAASIVDRAQIVRALFPTVRSSRDADGLVTTFSLDRG